MGNRDWLNAEEVLTASTLSSIDTVYMYCDEPSRVLEVSPQLQRIAK